MLVTMKISQLQSHFQESYGTFLLTQVRQLTSHLSSLELEEASTLEDRSVLNRLGKTVSYSPPLSWSLSGSREAILCQASEEEEDDDDIYDSHPDKENQPTFRKNISAKPLEL
jgi:hypothetical protein